MEKQEIKQLLERYWQCETSLEEEQILLAFFSGEDLPEDLNIYQALFTRTHKQLAIKAEGNLLTRINKPLKQQFYPALKVAASILILLTVGIGFVTHIQQEKQIDKMFSDTYTDPEDAVKETEQVVAKVSSVLQFIQEKNILSEILDSVKVKEPNSSQDEDIELPQ